MFFSMDRLKYKRFWPRYIADMYDLRTNNPNSWRKMETGNISVTKSKVPFASIGADYACEHVTNVMKVRLHTKLTLEFSTGMPALVQP